MAQIAALIDKRDTFEVIRDELAAILLVESTRQVELAQSAGKNADDWRLRVFLERSNPLEEFQEPAEGSDEDDVARQVAPIVNVSYENSSFEMAASNLVERQKASATYNIDCYGYGVAQDLPGGGHRPGDEDAALDCHRAVRLVRNILMSGPYTYLGLRGTVWRRFIQSINVFRPTSDGQPVQQVVAARIALTVEFNELSPQVEGPPLELVSVTVERAESGEIFMTATYGGEP